MAFCRWYDKQFEDVSEHEQEQCEENGQDCRTCPDLIADSKEVREIAKTFREAADVLDEMADFAENRKEMTKEEKESKEEELLGRFAAKMIKIQRFS